MVKNNEILNIEAKLSKKSVEQITKQLQNEIKKAEKHFGVIQLSIDSKKLLANIKKTMSELTKESDQSFSSIDKKNYFTNIVADLKLINKECGNFSNNISFIESQIFNLQNIINTTSGLMNQMTTVNNNTEDNQGINSIKDSIEKLGETFTTSIDKVNSLWTAMSNKEGTGTAIANIDTISKKIKSMPTFKSVGKQKRTVRYL